MLSLPLGLAPGDGAGSPPAAGRTEQGAARLPPGRARIPPRGQNPGLGSSLAMGIGRSPREGDLAGVPFAATSGPSLCSQLPERSGVWHPSVRDSERVCSWRTQGALFGLSRHAASSRLEQAGALSLASDADRSPGLRHRLCVAPSCNVPDCLPRTPRPVPTPPPRPPPAPGADGTSSSRPQECGHRLWGHSQRSPEGWESRAPSFRSPGPSTAVAATQPPTHPATHAVEPRRRREPQARAASSPSPDSPPLESSGVRDKA